MQQYAIHQLGQQEITTSTAGQLLAKLQQKKLISITCPALDKNRFSHNRLFTFNTVLLAADTGGCWCCSSTCETETRVTPCSRCSLRVGIALCCLNTNKDGLDMFLGIRVSYQQSGKDACLPEIIKEVIEFRYWSDGRWDASQQWSGLLQRTDSLTEMERSVRVAE